MSRERLNNVEVQKRVDKCFDLRYKSETPILQKEWIAYCHEHYGDKSEQQYHAYWASAKERYDNGWKEKLSKLLGPAVDKIIEGLESEDSRTYQKAVEQVFKYTGNEIDRQEIKQEVTYYKAKFGDDD